MSRYLYEARLLMEPYAAARAAVSIGTDTLADIKRLLEQSDALIETSVTDSVAKLIRVDTQFHRAIAVESGNSVMSKIMDTLQIRVQVFLLRRHRKQVEIEAPNQEHKAILAALHKHDPDLAAETMNEHLKRSRARYWP